MNQSCYVIGVDIGTTSTKSILVSETGKILTQQSQSYSLHSPVPQAAEQDPEDILSAVITTVRDVVDCSAVDSSSIACLSFSAAMHSLIAVDAEGKPLTACLTWADNRSAKWAKKIKEDYGEYAVYQRTGTPIHAISPLVKLVWLRQEMPEVFYQTAKFISIKDYILYRLFHQYVVDYSTAAAMGLLNLSSLTWDGAALAIAGITEKQLPQIVPSTEILQPLEPDYASVMGICTDIPVVVGASDGILSNLGVGAIAPNVVAVNIGTSGAVRAVVTQPTLDPQARLFCYPLKENFWIVGGAVNNGGIILRWLKEQLAVTETATAQLLKQDTYELLMTIAGQVPPGAEGLIFHPYLLGERAPLWNANARGSFFGLSLHHSKAHLIRAVIEGIIYNLHLVWQVLQTSVGETHSVRAAGGFLQSSLSRQMLADIFEREVIVPCNSGNSGLGAAILGLYALSRIPGINVDVVTEIVGQSDFYQPIADHVTKYRQILPLYRRLLDSFQAEYANIANLQTKLANHS